MSWPRDMHMQLDTQLFESLGISNYPEAVNEAVLLSALRLLCATHSLDLRVIGQKSTAGAVELSVSIKMSREMASAFIAKLGSQTQDLSVSAITVPERDTVFWTPR